MTKILAILSAGAALALVPTTGALAQKTSPAVIVVVDTQRVFAECTACKAAQAQLQTQAQQVQQRAQQLGQPLQTEATAIQTAANGKQPDAALQTRIKALQTKQEAAQQEIQGREQTFQRNRAYVSQQINAKLSPVIEQVMRTHGGTIALDQDATLAAASSLDVTNEVLTALNSQLASVSTTAPAAAPAATPPATQQPVPNGR